MMIRVLRSVQGQKGCYKMMMCYYVHISQFFLVFFWQLLWFFVCGLRKDVQWRHVFASRKKKEVKENIINLRGHIL